MDENEQGEYIPHQTGGSLLARPDDLLPETIQIIPVTTRPFFQYSYSQLFWRKNRGEQASKGSPKATVNFLV